MVIMLKIYSGWIYNEFGSGGNMNAYYRNRYRVGNTSPRNDWVAFSGFSDKTVAGNNGKVQASPVCQT